MHQLTAAHCYTIVPSLLVRQCLLQSAEWAITAAPDPLPALPRELPTPAEQGRTLGWAGSDPGQAGGSYRCPAGQDGTAQDASRPPPVQSGLT